MHRSACAPLAARMARIEPFHVMSLLAQARALEQAGRDIVHMEVGEPDFQTPEPVVEAGVAALRAGRTHYTPALGLPALREAIADYYSRRYGLRVDPGRVVVTPGATGGLQLVLAALVGRDDRVLMADPGYPCNRQFVRQFEGQPVGVPVGPDSAYQLTPGLVERHWDAGCVAALVASPANPTGTLIADDHLRAMARFLASEAAAFVVDEIYHGLVYTDHPGTAAALEGAVFVVNSFSKYFGMTGWRLGWIVAPADYIGALDTLAQNMFIAAPTPAQYAALTAFSSEVLEILEDRRELFRQRRDYLVDALRGLGFGVPVVPQGAFYVYADCGRFTPDSFDLAQRLLNEAGVAVTPGLDFGAHAPARHLRFAYTTDLDRLERGVGRIRDFLATQ